MSAPPPIRVDERHFRQVSDRQVLIVGKGQRAAGHILAVMGFGLLVISAFATLGGSIGVLDLMGSNRDRLSTDNLLWVCGIVVGGFAVMAISSVMIMLGNITAGKQFRVQPGRLVAYLFCCIIRDMCVVCIAMSFLMLLFAALSGLWLGLWILIILVVCCAVILSVVDKKIQFLQTLINS